MSETKPLSILVAMSRVSFEEDLYRLMTEEGLSRSELADRIGASTAYISKIFNGTTNYTLKTMAKLAQAVGANVQVRLCRDGEEVARVMDVETAIEFDAAHGAEFEGEPLEVPVPCRPCEPWQPTALAAAPASKD